MRIVVTGLSGNIGTALLQRLGARADEHDIVGVSRRPPRGGEPYHLASWVCVDLASELARPTLTEVFEGADAVVHLAWAFQPARDLDYLDRVTVGGSHAVLAAADSARVPHLIHMSSVGVYSPAPTVDRLVPVGEDYPRRGIDSLAYSRQKVAVEDDLDAYEASRAQERRTLVTRLRPGLVMQRAAASGILRYGAPPWLPAAFLRHLPVILLDRSIVFPAVHSDDVAAAIIAALDRKVAGAFNLAADPALTRDEVAGALGAHGVHLPLAVLRGAAGLAWRAQLQPLDPGWIDLLGAVPLLDCSRAVRELGWTPKTDARDALRELVAGMGDSAGTASAPLRRRSVMDELRALVGRGPVTGRQQS